MNYQNLEQKFTQVLYGEVEIATPNTITVSENGYDVFGCYQIIPGEGWFDVWQNGTLCHTFSSTRIALSWCIADKYNKHDLGQDIARLDAHNRRMSQDIEARRNLIRSFKQSDRCGIAKDKLHHKEYQHRQVKARLAKCVNLAKYFQIRGFNDEIARTRRPLNSKTTHASARKSGR